MDGDVNRDFVGGVVRVGDRHGAGGGPLRVGRLAGPGERGVLGELVRVLHRSFRLGQRLALLHCDRVAGLRVVPLRVGFVGLSLCCGGKAHLHRVVVGGTERVAVAVELVIALAEEVLRVVITTGVLERDRLIAVDVPHCGILDELLCCRVG